MKIRAARRLSPGLVAWLAFLWLLLNQTVAPGQIVLAFVVAASLSWLSSALRPLPARVRNPQVIVALLATVFVDVVRSNVAVGRIVLGLVRGREVKSGFLDIPLELRDPHGLAGLAMIVTATPGTVWVDLARDGSRVTLHILDLEDEAYWIDWIKNRYERPLRRIFE
ncbi:MAG TPA: Na+/H+ antiporter subunit E [Woeseiaceae bacterium]|nr:Na+/H+ antiporter subunit E [Woeseiaceae bacterium]